MLGIFDVRGRRRRQAWLDEQVHRWQGLLGATVVGWRGIEMAVRGGDEAPFQFGGDDVPCLVFWGLSMTLKDGTALEIGTQQDDDVWGLHMGATVPGRLDDQRVGNGYRYRVVDEMAAGTISLVTVRLDAESDLVAEVNLRVAGRDLLLMAGEPNEDWTGRIVWNRLDESVLVFTEPGRPDRMSWTPGREPDSFKKA